MKRTAFLALASVIAASLAHGYVHAQNPYNQWRAWQGLNQVQRMQNMQTAQTWQNNWQNQQTFYNLNAQTQGTNFGIPFNYATVASYYAPYSTPYYGGGGYSPYFPGYPAYTPPVATPYGANPYAPTGPGYGLSANPYSPYGGGGDASGYNPYNPYNNQYSNPYAGPGQSLMGAADVMRSYGQVITSQESARILREQALQAKLETKKKAFDLDMYIKANTPTYTQQQEAAARDTLRRIQTNSLPGEVQNGKSLNYLLKDLAKVPNRKERVTLEPLGLSEGVLSHINVTKNTYGMGILREGQVSWPTAIQLPANQRKQLEDQIKDLVKESYSKGKPNAAVLKDVRKEMENLREDLMKKVNEIPSNQYMDAKRFLMEFDHATIAMEKGEAPLQAKFQRFIEGGRSAQEVADYMIKEGLVFGPATADDEAAYRAVHAAMANYDVAMNAQLGGDVKE